MANATSNVKQGTIDFTQDGFEASSATLGAETSFYPNATLGWTTGGYLAKFDDTQSMILAGVVKEQHGVQVLPAGTAGDGTIELRGEKPRYLDITITSVAVTDIGKPVYALYDNQGTLDTAATTYGNVLGCLVGVPATNVGRVELAYDGIAANARLGAARRMAATGAQTVTRFDIGKTVFCANSAALAITLPAIATIPQGGKIQFVKDHASDANAITLTGNSSDNIDGSNTLATMDAAWDCAELVSNNARWVVVNRDIA